ncbi:hypothetical protein QN277_013065 [Acacia crassicarpa]|uniref:Myb/SANT-like DNA-binding domain-containing protein n=1 Tax=Acacia crassicarpa TaxID=499986 RepID=A0AAE1N2T3_9FABA|nr:hypothetical protein QN277_013065 [Acacia crassicarpa]
MFSGISSGLLGVENQLQQQQQNLSNPQNPHPMHHSQVVSYASSHHETDIPQPPPQQSIKHGYPFPAKINQQMALSDEDEAGFAAEDNVSSGDKRKVSQWHRMKWTDTMVKLLIMAVYYIGDEGGSEGADKKKPAGGLLQKKGKWKSVSRAMTEKGFFVSPQQCEDKFNDLNKRYKRVNDILGKGTACLVVENHSLLETMDLTPKRKEEVRKLLNSKHLFFRQMCAYHNSCGHVTSGGLPQQQSPEVGTEPSQATQPQQQQRCSHSSEVGMANLGKPESEGLKISKEASREEDEDDDEDEESEDSSEEEGEESGEGEGVSRGHKTGNSHEDEDENYEGKPSSMKRARKAGMCSSMSSKGMQETSNEVMGVLQDGARSTWEKRQWMKRKVMQLEEQQLRYGVEAFELEKQKLKWARFSSKKEREMERAKLENQRRQLENERMVLLLRQKDLELLSQSSPSPTTAAATFF